MTNRRNSFLTNRFTAALGVSLLAASALSGCKKQEAPAGAFVMPPALVTTTTAIGQDVPLFLDEIGRCVTYEMVSILPQVSGKITGVHFTDGADLKRGDKLFTIDPRPYQAMLSQAEANLAQDRVALDLAKIEMARVEKLIAAKAVSQQDYDTRKNAVAATEASIKSREAAVEMAKINLEYTTIVSPIDGRAGEALVDAGNVVMGNTNTSLMTIQALDPIYADFTVTEANLTRVRKQMESGTLKANVKLPTDEGDGREGNLTFVDNAVQDATGTIKLRVTLPNKDRHFWPGQFVNVRLVLATLKNAVLIPSQATQIGQKGPFIYVVKNDMTAELRPVLLGQRQGDLVVVEKGLEAGEQVVLTGQLAVMPGGKVNPQKPATQPAGPANGGDGK